MFLMGFFTNDEKNSFMVRLGVTLTLNAWNLTGPFALVVSWFLRSALGLLVMGGKFAMDLELDALQEGVQLREFQEEAAKAYALATARVYDEGEKEAIRQQYLDIVDRFTRLSSV